jgi:hypothetical protein
MNNADDIPQSERRRVMAGTPYHVKASSPPQCTLTKFLNTFDGKC